MALLKLPKQFDPYLGLPGRKPVGPVEVDWSNPLTKGLVSIWLMSDNGDTAIDIVSGNDAPLVNSAFSTVSGEKCIDFSASNAELYISTLPTTLAITGSLTVLSRFKASSYAAEQYLLGTDAATEGTASQNCIYSLAITASKQFKSFWEFGTGSNVEVVGSAAPIVSDKWHNVVMSRKAASTSDVSFTMDGIKVGSTSTGNTNASGGSASPLVIGGLRSATTAQWSGDISVTAIYDRALSDSEAARLSADPFQILKSANEPVYFTPSDVGGTYTLTADVTAYTLGSDTANLEWDRILTADVTAYTLSADAVNLTYTPAGSYTLTCDVTAYTLGSDAANLFYNPAITADVTAYTLSSDAVNLTYNPVGSYTISADVTAYTLGGDEVNLTYARIFTADSTSYTLSFAAATLTKGLLDTPNCFTWLVSEIVSYEYLLSDIDDSVTYKVSLIDDSATYLVSNIDDSVLYLRGDLCS